MSFSESMDSAFDYAADLDGSGNISGTDASALSRAVSGYGTINYAARTL